MAKQKRTAALLKTALCVMAMAICLTAVPAMAAGSRKTKTVYVLSSSKTDSTSYRFSYNSDGQLTGIRGTSSSEPVSYKLKYRGSKLSKISGSNLKITYRYSGSRLIRSSWKKTGYIVASGTQKLSWSGSRVKKIYINESVNGNTAVETDTPSYNSSGKISSYTYKFGSYRKIMRTSYKYKKGYLTSISSSVAACPYQVTVKKKNGRVVKVIWHNPDFNLTKVTTYKYKKIRVPANRVSAVKKQQRYLTSPNPDPVADTYFGQIAGLIFLRG